MLVFDGMINAKTIKPQGTDQSAIVNVLRPPGDEWTMAAHSQPGLRHCVLACISCPHEVGAMSSEMKRLRQLEEENGKLKRIVADLSLDKAMLQDVIRRKL
jgi:hypothetical protein